MKNTALALTLALASVIALPVSAAIEYEYIQTSRSNGDDSRPGDLTARAVIDGDRVRVDFVSGNTYPPGTYMVTTDGMRRMSFVDPLNKSFTEVNTSTIVSAIATTDIKVANLRSEVTKLEDRQIIAGISTEHYRLSLSYDVTVTYRNMPIKQSVQTVIDQWTTVQFGDAMNSVTGNSLMTANPEVDKLIEIETTKVKGFPLKQRIQTTTVSQSRPNGASELKVPTSQTKTREITVTSIKQAPVTTAKFSVPEGYRRNDGTAVPTKAPMQILQMDGTTK